MDEIEGGSCWREKQTGLKGQSGPRNERAMCDARGRKEVADRKREEMISEKPHDILDFQIRAIVTWRVQESLKACLERERGSTMYEGRNEKDTRCRTQQTELEWKKK